MTAILILGQPRSGTTLITNLLNKSGVFVGDRLLQQSEDWCPNGEMYTDLDFRDMHQLLAEPTPRRFRPDELAKYEKLIDKREKENPIWAVKCHLMPYGLKDFFSITDKLGTVVKAIVTERDITISAQSLAERTNMSIENCLSFINYSNSIIEQYLPKIKTLFVSFDSLIDKPTETTKKIVKFAGTTWKSELAQIVDAQWRRF